MEGSGVTMLAVTSACQDNSTRRVWRSIGATSAKVTFDSVSVLTEYCLAGSRVRSSDRVGVSRKKSE